MVFLNGYQANCQNVSFQGTFGAADKTLAALNKSVLYFDNCTAKGTIEDLGNAFGRYLDGLRYTDGSPVTQVDAIAHSMGGLILRSYLAGRQNNGTYNPPADPRIRKVIFLATPHAGIAVATLAGGLDPQLEGLTPGSPVVFGLATWNQGTENLREIDALSLSGDAGAGLLSVPRFTDGVVALTSSSLEQWLPGRTRVLPGYCHTSSSPCVPNSPDIADLTDTSRDSVKAVLSFLRDTTEWRNIGKAPAEFPMLATTSGLQVQFRDKDDKLIPITKSNLSVRNSQTAWTEKTPSGPTQVTANDTTSASVDAPKGGTGFQMIKSGPFISAALPAQATGPRVVAPGEFVSIYGSELASTTAQAATQPYPTSLANAEVRFNNRAIPVQYVSPNQINVLIPDDAVNFGQLSVVNPAGQHTINVLVEPVVPAIFVPVNYGSYTTIYLTGLGRTEKRADGLEWALQLPEVTVGEKPCPVTYAGRAPGFAGLDQINCTLAADVAPNAPAAVAVRSGRRVSTSSLPAR